MVTIIKTNSSIRKTIAYNENKVKTGLAQCIGAGNYPVDLERISTDMKLQRFTKRTALNQNTKRNTIHISLNFSPSESYSKELLMNIAVTYMEKIGFSKQPYLVYQHYDAGHLHLHVISTNIQKDGKGINLYNIGINKSEPARKEIEKLFDLVKAGSQNPKKAFNFQPVSIKRVHYGQVESIKAISDVLSFVLNQYKYTNFSDLNALLGQYNIIAERCGENSKTFLSRGLFYKILNEKGTPIGVPIKASTLSNKPTLKFLENKFKSNTIESTVEKIKIKKIVDFYLSKFESIDQFTKTLQRRGITTILSKKADGKITFIDHQTKSIFSNNILSEHIIEKSSKQSNALKNSAGNRRKNPVKKTQLPNH